MTLKQFFMMATTPFRAVGAAFGPSRTYWRFWRHNAKTWGNWVCMSHTYLAAQSSYTTWVNEGIESFMANRRTATGQSKFIAGEEKITDRFRRVLLRRKVTST